MKSSLSSSSVSAERRAGVCSDLTRHQAPHFFFWIFMKEDINAGNTRTIRVERCCCWTMLTSATHIHKWSLSPSKIRGQSVSRQWSCAREVNVVILIDVNVCHRHPRDGMADDGVNLLCYVIENEWHIINENLMLSIKTIKKDRKDTFELWSVFSSKLRPHFKILSENNTWLRYEFLKILARSEKTHFCLKFSKNKLKLKKSNPVVAVRVRH